MNSHGLTPMTRLEAVVDASDVRFVEQLLEAEGVTGWTGVPAASGFGHGGRSEGRLMFNDHTGPTTAARPAQRRSATGDHTEPIAPTPHRDTTRTGPRRTRAHHGPTTEHSPLDPT